MAKLDLAKLEAAGLRVEVVTGGVMVATKQMKQAQFVPMVGDRLQLVLERSSLHRQINAALGHINPTMPGGQS